MSAQPIVMSGGPSSQSIYDVTTSPRHRPGTRGYLPDGRVFYYTENTSGAALTIGELQVHPELVANHQNLDVADDSLVVGSDVITAVTLGATEATVNQYKDGYLNVISNGGAGQMFQIRSHAAIDSAGTGDFYIYGKVAVASDASTQVSLQLNPYRSPQQGNVDQEDVPVGVPTVTIPIGSTDAQYGWLQTWGPCAVRFDEGIATVGQAVTIGVGTVGRVEEDDTATTESQEFIVGYTLQVATDGEHQIVDLRIRP